MASNLYKIIKPDLKRYQKSRLYMRQSNYLISNEPYQNSKCYRIDLNFLADQNKPLIDIFLTFFDSIHEIKNITSTTTSTAPLKYNQIFVLMVKNYFLCDLFLPKVVKASEEDRMANFQIIGFSNIQYLDQLSLSRQIRELCQTLKAEMQGKLNTKLQEALKESKQGEEQKNRLKLDIINTILRQQKEKTIQNIIGIQHPSIKEIYVPKEMKDVERLYLKKVIDTLISLRFTKKFYRSLKFANFIQKKYKGYYNLNYLKQHGNNIRQKRQNKFILKRYTNNDNEYLTDLFSLVKMRNDQQNYDSQMFQASKQLLKALISHNKTTKSAYPLLSSHSIIFNQISLKMQLSYQNPLLQALGLLSKPMNTENTVCFMATPVPYDTYASQAELQNPQLQTNHLIGMNQILKEHYRIPALSANSDLAIEKRQAEQASQSWRFMLTVHFLMHGKEYYRTAGSQTFMNLHNFKEFVEKQEQKLKSPQSKGYFTSIFGSNFMRFVPHKVHDKQYDPSLNFFENLFIASEDSDSIIEQFGHIKINRYLKLFAHTLRQLLNLTSNELFSKVYNTIHHLLRFYLGIFLQISQILTVCQYFSKNQTIGLQLFKELAAKIAKETSARRSYIEISYQKFKQYKRRQNEHPESQYDYLNKQFRDQYNGIQDLYSFHSSTKVKISQFSEQDTNERFNIQIQSKKEKIVTQMLASLKGKLQKIRPIITSIIFNQFILSKQASNSSQKRPFLACKLELLTTIVLGLSQQNFITVQSIIMPALEANSSMQDNPPPNNKSEQRYREQRELCDYCLQIMIEQAIELNLNSRKMRACKQHEIINQNGHFKKPFQNI